MKTFLRIIGGLVVLGIVCLLAFIFVPVQRSAPAEELAANWEPEPGQGEYVMHASDCVACHTAEGGEPLAGGRAIASPMGTIWSTNITPDAETGIGEWSYDDFRAAMVDGIAKGGTHLYPAMPYENYRLMKEEDIRALYDYLMAEVEPVSNEVQETQLKFPFNLRFGIRAWNWLALTHDAGFNPVGASELQDRGQYLVEGPGHCAACHSPRTPFMSQDGVTADEDSFLTGGVIDGWNAPALRGEGSAPQAWSVGELADYLATGRNAHSAANGEMGLVVEHSLQYLTDEDNLAMAAFLKGMDGAKVETPETVADAGPIVTPDPEADDAGRETAEMLISADPEMPLGARLYTDNCIGCHFATGKGAPGIFPELQDNHLVTGSETKPLISVILNGAEVPGTAKRPMTLRMQGYADRMSDDEVAELATWLRKAWGNDAGAVSASDVAAVRGADATH
ncbi:cytochrome c [Salipiger sp. PrR002]|uniref:cytochrome c n=1 Tax=Salipiger sp. PrR002 TaxID=2706489 RepID=UPI0013B679B1|nr:cytochrome c [Salipiger sp. PrR002]NDV99921.1 c-type cytochrome [Salipiger sp. PrR002]NDW56286.1 c-type cytochrome [Salipiger sp. PrR004]